MNTLGWQLVTYPITTRNLFLYGKLHMHLVNFIPTTSLNFIPTTSFSPYFYGRRNCHLS